MKVKIEETTKTFKEIEVALPYYHYRDYGGDAYDSEEWSRIDENMEEVSISRYEHFRHNDLIKWELEIDQATEGTLAYYHSGEKSYDNGKPSNAKAFNGVLKEFQDIVAAIKQHDT